MKGDRNRLLRLGRALGLAVILCLMLVSGSQANAGPPPNRIELTFDFELARPLKIEGVQVVGCDSPKCDQPELLQQYGRCEALPCLDAPPRPAGWRDQAGCVGQSCIFISDAYHGVDFKLIVQFADQTLDSGLAGRLPGDYYGSESHWRVTVGEERMTVTPEAPEQAPSPFNAFFLGLVLTQLVELLLAAAYLRFRLGGEKLLLRLLMIYLVNLATFPVVWLVFPSLEALQTASFRTFGIIVLVVVFVYLVLLAQIFRAETAKRRLWTLVGSVVVLIVALIAGAIAAFVASYGNYQVVISGLPESFSLPLSELFAVLCEAVMLVVLSKGALPPRQAGEVSLLMNIASFVVGLFLLS